MRRRLRNLSLRARLVIGIVILMAIALAVADIASIALMRSYQLDRIDQQLTAGPPTTSGTPADLGTAQLCTLLTRTEPGSTQLPTRYALAIYDDRDDLLCQLPKEQTSLGMPDLTTIRGRLAELASAQEPVTVPGTERHAPWRARVVEVGGGHAVIAISLTDAMETAARLQLTMLVISVVMIALAAMGGWLVVRLGLRPLTTIEETADAIASGDLSQRIDAAPETTEVGRLAASLNSMLGQIEQGFDERLRTEDRLRQFLADASHELRTPLASIRGHAEMYRQGVVTEPADVAVIMDRIESESVRMSDLVNDLLLLARLDTSPGLASAPVDLLSTATDVVLDARARAPHRPVRINQLGGVDWVDAPPVVVGDESRIRQILTNLISNVLRYTPDDSPYEVVIGVRAAEVVVSVVDHGPGLSQDAVPRVFERFYRGDYGRDRHTGGAGLGLSIVAGLMGAHQGTVSYQPTPGGGSTFVLGFPLSEAPHNRVGMSRP